jgi:hypothetical protein
MRVFLYTGVYDPFNGNIVRRADFTVNNHFGGTERRNTRKYESDFGLDSVVVYDDVVQHSYHPLDGLYRYVRNKLVCVFGVGTLFNECYTDYTDFRLFFFVFTTYFYYFYYFIFSTCGHYSHNTIPPFSRFSISFITRMLRNKVLKSLFITS